MSLFPETQVDKIYGPKSLWAEIAMGRNCYGPKLTWADFVMGRNDPEPLAADE